MSKALKTSGESLITTTDIYNEIGEQALEMFKGSKKVQYGLNGASFEIDFTKAVPKQDGFNTRVRKPLMRYRIEAAVTSSEVGAGMEVTVTRGVTKVITNSCTDKKKLSSMVKDTLLAIIADGGEQAEYYQKLASESVADDIKILAQKEDFQGFFTAIPEAGYHQCPGVSKSQLVHMKKTYNHFKHAQNNQKDPSDAMVLGSATHIKILEPKRYKEEVVVMDLDKRSSEGKVAAALNSIVNAGRMVIDSDDQSRILGMEESLKKHPVIPSIIKESQFETSLFWKNELGSLSRGRADGMIMEPSKSLAKLLSECTPYTEEQVLESVILWDLKTTDSAAEEDFVRKVYDQDYHVQAAYYSSGVTNLTGRPVIFIFVAVESSGVFQCDYHILGEADIELGQKTYMKWLTKLDEHKKNPKKWGGYAIQKQRFAALPRYAFAREEE